MLSDGDRRAKNGNWQRVALGVMTGVLGQGGNAMRSVCRFPKGASTGGRQTKNDVSAENGVRELEQSLMRFQPFPRTCGLQR